MSLDLSVVTDTLTKLVQDQWATAPIWAELANPPVVTFTPNFTGLAPDAVSTLAGPQLSMFLYHVESNKAMEGLFWQPQMVDPTVTGQPTRFLPLALDLYYLLFAHADSHNQEQEAMSVALRIFHGSPIVRSDPTAAVPWELTLTMEHRSYDELSRLWQATTAPLRMSLVYRAAVVFIDPDTMPAAAPDTSSFAVAVGTVPPPDPAHSLSAAFGTLREGTYAAPEGVTVPFAQSPATVAAGQTVWLTGSDLGVSGLSDSVYLLPPGGGAEVDVTAWAVPGESSAAKFVLALPAAAGTAPAGTPDPGVYQLRVGSGALGSPGAIRTGPVPVSVAAFVDPAGGPVLAGSAPFTVHGTGFVPGATEVLVGTAALTDAAPPQPGEVSVDPSGTSFSFSPPAGPAGLVAPVRVRVNGVESDPAQWVTL